jgi:hypothetical protein
MTMATTAERLDETQAIQEIARVERVEKGEKTGLSLSIRASGGLYRDLVLAAVTSSGRAWVLSILEREEEGAAVRMSTEGDLEIAATGKLDVIGGEVEVRARREAKLTAPKLSFTAFDLGAAVERLVLAGGSAHVNLESAKTVVSFADQVFERLSTNAKRVYRYIEELDLTRAHQIEVRAETTAHIRSKQTFMTSDDLVKVEADQIHLG